MMKQVLSNYFEHLHLKAETIKEIHPDYSSIYERLNSAWLELDDLRAEVDQLQPEVEMIENADELEARLNVLNKLQIKHQVQNADELIRVKERYENLLNNTNDLEEKINHLQSNVISEETALINKAQKISKNRNAVIGEVSQKVIQLLKKMGMSHAQFEINVTEKEELNNYGLNTIKFLFSANKGSALQPIQKVASGGELSRLMLAIKSLLASSVSLPTLIFDEIDTGISGETAAHVSDVLYKLSKNHQVITITHLPQIAAKGKGSLFHLQRS